MPMLRSFRLSRLERLTAFVLLPALFAALFSGVALTALLHRHVQTSITELNELRDVIDARYRQIDANFHEIRALADAPCSLPYLTRLEHIVVASQLIQDIVFHSDGQLCSAVSEEAAAMYQRDTSVDSDLFFITTNGMEVQRNVHFLFAAGVSFNLATQGPVTFIVRNVDYARAISGKWPGTLSIITLDWVSGRVILLDGPPVPYAQLPVPAFSLGGTAFESATCTANERTCLVLRTTYLAFLARNMAAIGFFLLLGAALGRLAGAAFLAWRRHQRSMLRRLRLAIRDRQLSVQYQPIADTGTGLIVAAEALIRWTVPSGDRIPPDVFIPVAEAADITSDITCLVIERVADEFAYVLRKHRSFVISINIVPDDLSKAAFFDAIRRHLEGSNIRPEQIAFEITERQEMRSEGGVAAMRTLRTRGYNFYIDDFGTGYSSVAYLDDLPVSAIKIDRSFTATVGTDFARSRLVRPMLDMARELSLSVIAEGVETATQASFFRDNHAARLQGWLFGRPMAANDLITLIRDQAAGRAAG